MVEVGAGEHHPRSWKKRLACKLGHVQLSGKAVRGRKPAYPPTAIVTPASTLLIIPAAIPEMLHICTMRSAAMLAAPFGALKPDKCGQLAPVDRIEPAMFRADRHEAILSQSARERKQKIAYQTGIWALFRCRDL